MTKTKIYAVLLAGAICISLMGCGKSAPVSESETVQVNAEETADETSGIDTSDVISAEPTVSKEPEPPAESSASEPQQPTEKEKPEAEPASEQTEPPVQTESQKPAEPAEPQQPQEPPAAQTQPPEPEPAPAETSKPTEPAPQEPQPTPPEQTPEEAKPKTAYDYEFDIEAIKADCIGIGQSMGLTLDSSLTPDNASWWNPVTASSGNQGEALKQSLASYITFHTVENLSTYGIDEITSFNICCEARGNGAYAIYFLFA